MCTVICLRDTINCLLLNELPVMCTTDWSISTTKLSAYLIKQLQHQTDLPISSQF